MGGHIVLVKISFAVCIIPTLCTLKLGKKETGQTIRNESEAAFLNLKTGFLVFV